MKLSYRCGVAAILIAVAGLATAQDAPAKNQPAPAAAEKFANADDLLMALETADKDLATLTADIKYDKISGLMGDRQIRKGKLFFEDKGDKGGKRERKFSVRFEQLQLGDRVEDEIKLMVFDGRWLIEVSPKIKQVMKREVVPEGEKFDPLKIGEGPLPLPIGQKKADIVRKFDVTLLADTADLEGDDDAETQLLGGFVKGAYQLKMTPKPGSAEAEKYKEVRLWYREGGADEGGGRLLPRMARTVAPNGDVSLVRMINVKTNVPVDPAMMAAVEPGKDWNVVVEALPTAKSK